jgi:outer membrane immunogenic protein
MRNIILTLLTGMAGLVVVHTAEAADLPRKAPAYVPVPVYSWTGCYIGGNVGYGWGRTQESDFLTLPGFDIGSDTGTGVVGGGQIGCDYQTANWVFGVQGMFDGSGVKGSLVPNGANSAFNPIAFTANETHGFKTEWFATLTGRIGYVVWPQALLYLKGGAAWAHNTYSDSDPIFAGTGYLGKGSANPSGWTIGGGLEYTFLPNWSAFVEYNFIDFGSRNVTIIYNVPADIVTNPYGYHYNQNLQTVLVGLNYRFTVWH